MSSPIALCFNCPIRGNLSGKIIVVEVEPAIFVAFLDVCPLIKLSEVDFVVFIQVDHA